jgi:hypothetical protein
MLTVYMGEGSSAFCTEKKRYHVSWAKIDRKIPRKLGEIIATSYFLWRLAVSFCGRAVDSFASVKRHKFAETIYRQEHLL